MIGIKASIDTAFEKFAKVLYRNPLKTLGAVAIVTFGLVAQLPRLTTDMSTESFLPKEDPARVAFDDFRRQFGRDEVVAIMVEPKEVFSAAFLEELRQFHGALEREVPYLDEVLSLANARETRGLADSLLVGELLNFWEQEGASLPVLRQRVLANPVYRNQLISEDGRFAMISVKTLAYADEAPLDGGASGFADSGVAKSSSSGGADMGRRPLSDLQNSEIVVKIREIVARHERDDFRVFVAGGPVVTEDHRASINRDMKLYVQISLAVMVAALVLMFRRISGVLLPLLVVLLSVLATFGLMGLFGVPMRMTTSMLPSFLLVAGVADSVHILAIFYQRLEITGSREQALGEALGHSGLAVVITSLTTAVGLGSFLTADMTPIADLGRFGPSGVVVALLYTLVLLPVLIALFPINPRHGDREKLAASFMTRGLEATARFATHFPKAIVAVTVFLLLFSGLGLTRITFSHDVLQWLPPEFPLRKHTERIDREFKGTVNLEVVVDTGRENGLYNIEVLGALDRLGREVAGMEQDGITVGATSSLVAVLKEVHRALNENRPEFYRVPADPKIIPQEFLLFEFSGSDDLESLVDSQFSLARFSIRVPSRNAFLYLPFGAKVEERFRQQFAGLAKVTSTGMLAMQTRSAFAAINSMAKSYLAAGAAISVMMVLLIGSPRAGFLSIIPNLLPILLVLGAVGWLEIRFDMFTMLVGTIAVGIVVDDTIHFMVNFRRYYLQKGDANWAVSQTLGTTGRAMLVTTVVLSAGFLSYTQSSLDNLFLFGLFTALCILLALVADFLVAPALMVLAYPTVRGVRDKPGSFSPVGGG